MSQLLVYGSYGYTGRLIVQKCVDAGIRPIIAGRNREKLERQASTYGLTYEVFDLHQGNRLREFLQKGEVVLHCAGPFAYTAQAMIEACLETHTHYLDITGEYEVFDLLQGYADRAEQINLTILPGVGFDVVPSDCLSALLHERMPEATHLELAFMSKGAGLSRGTTKTMIDHLGKGQAFREDGKLTFAKMGEMTRLVDFGELQQTCMGISWGDISTAYYSTGIPNIKVYAGTSPKQIAQIRKVNTFKWFFRWRPIREYLKKQLDKKPDGPSEEKRTNAKTYLWGQVRREEEVSEMRMVIPNGYVLTADASVKIAEKVMNGDFKSGFQTPATAYGYKLLEELEGVRVW